MKLIKQLVKFAIIGVSNTLITAVLIWIFLRWLHFNDYLANVLSYIIGLINSFVWNRNWTFADKGHVWTSLIKFAAVFVVCYLIQLGTLSLLLKYTTIDNYVSQLLAIVAYTIPNFLINKYFTFKND